MKNGSVVAGFFKYPDGYDAIYVANHEALVKDSTQVVLDMSNRKKKDDKPFVVGLFDRTTGKWTALPQEENCVKFTLAPAGGELLAVGPQFRRDAKTFEELEKSTGKIEWAEDAIQVAWDLEGSALKKSVDLYRQVAAEYKGQAPAEKASKRLALLEPRLEREIRSWEGYEKLLELSKGLRDVAGEPSTTKSAKWAAQNKAVVDRLQAGTKAIYAQLPDTMGATRARELCEKYEIDHGR